MHAGRGPPAAGRKTTTMNSQARTPHRYSIRPKDPAAHIFEVRLSVAQPDEVWNFQRGDGVERAVALANVWKSRHPDASIELKTTTGAVELTLDGRAVRFSSAKGLEKTIQL